MKKRKRLIPVFTLTWVLAAWAFPPSVAAQDHRDGDGGLFGRGEMANSSRSDGAIGGSLMGQGFGATNGNLTGQGFGVTNGNITGQTFGTPLGGGLFVLLAAGAGYATLKSKQSQRKNQNRKEK